ncbi:phage tail assembly protein [Burkholderia sp. Nafp2/4-1b]|uniref:phage tail assembly protein n=1 Tax=Burkholderia sp. Nafp2/4-1b TaxID=2116686 RepID=UPI000EF95ADF|nr:phage tail assembly protein [Burkholderia sp. Nafp2/4-1b]RKU01818.1 phage tail assembly protein [Burkholderia sp. Nafp2/4-1b]
MNQHAPASTAQHAHTDIDIAAQQLETPDPNTHTLDTPLVRGTQTITQVTLSKPSAGALRGTSLAALVNLEVDALRRVLPRISTPTLTEADVTLMDPADLVALGGIFAGFLMPKALKASMDCPSA